LVDESDEFVTRPLVDGQPDEESAELHSSPSGTSPMSPPTRMTRPTMSVRTGRPLGAPWEGAFTAMGPFKQPTESSVDPGAMAAERVSVREAWQSQ
jgi:hypothetical protein